MAKNMTEGKPLALILQFALPLLWGNLFQQAYNVVDAAIVGRYLGSDALGSVGATSSVQFLVFGFCIGICIGFSFPVAQQFGANRLKKMREFIFHGAILAVFFSIVVTIICALLCADIIHVLKISDTLYDNAYIYLLIIFLGIPCTILYNFLAGILRAIGDSRTPFLFLVISTILNIVLDIFCIVVLKLGCAGAALATVIAQGVSGVLCLLLILRKMEILHLHKEDMHYSRHSLLLVLQNGVPMGLQFSITAIGSMVLQSANNGLDNTAYIAAFAAGARIKQFAMCPFDAFATATSTFCSQNLGANKFDRIRDGLKKGLFIAVSYGVLMGIVLIFFGRQLTCIFVDSKETAVLDAAELFLFCAGFFFFLLGFLNVARLTIQGIGYANVAMGAGVLELIARIAVSLIFVPVYGFYAICFADQSAWLSAALFVVPVCFYLIRRAERQFINHK